MATNADSLSLDHMRAFIALSESGSQARAARALRPPMSQATVARYVQRVQEHFGGGLFEPGNGARLTARGMIVLRSLQTVIAELSQARGRVALDRPLLRIGFIRIMRPIVEHALRMALGERGDVEVRLVELHSERNARMLDERELDIAVCYAFDDLFEGASDVEMSLVTEQPIALVVPERAFVRGKLSLRALARLDYAHVPRRFSRELADAELLWLKRNGLKPRTAIECRLGTEIIAYAATGRGYGFLPALWSTTSHAGAAFAPLPNFAQTARIAAYSLPHVSPWVACFRESLVRAAHLALRDFP